MSTAELEDARGRMVRFGLPVQGASPDQIRQALLLVGEQFRDAAPMTAAEAAKVMDRLVREAPEDAYGQSLIDRLRAQVPWGLGGVMGLPAPFPAR